MAEEGAYWVPGHVRAYLGAMGFRLPLEEMEGHIAEWDRWMRAEGEFYDYRDTDGLGRVYEVHRRSIMPAMRAPARVPPYQSPYAANQLPSLASLITLTFRSLLAMHEARYLWRSLPGPTVRSSIGQETDEVMMVLFPFAERERSTLPRFSAPSRLLMQ